VAANNKTSPFVFSQIVKMNVHINITESDKISQKNLLVATAYKVSAIKQQSASELTE
jgi:hypothetical protein